MSKKLLMIGSIAIALAGGPALAGESAVQLKQDSREALQRPATDAERQVPPGSELSFIADQKKGQWLAGELIGQTLLGSNGDAIAEVHDLLYDSQGRISAVVIGVGGFLGIGEKLVAVNFASIMQMETRDGRPTYMLSATADQLESAPAFESREALERAERMRRAREHARERSVVKTLRPEKAE
jgi:hypothetical protein